MANELPGAATGSPAITFKCGASAVGDSLLVTNPSAFEVAGTASTAVFGVTCGATDAAGYGRVYLPGSKVSFTASEHFHAGDNLTMDANGKVQKQTAGEPIIGIALEDAVGDGSKVIGVFVAAYVVTAGG